MRQVPRLVPTVAVKYPGQPVVVHVYQTVGAERIEGTRQRMFQYRQLVYLSISV